jgi:hypothetical protein
MPPPFHLTAAHEWLAHDPIGRPKAADVSSAPCLILGATGAVVLRAARNGYASFRVLVRGQGTYHLAASMEDGLEIDVYKAWYHHMRGEEGKPATCWPDALIPTQSGGEFQLPDPENQIPDQTVQEFWIDVYLPAQASPGEVRGQICLVAGGDTLSLPVRVRVLEATLPDQPCLTMDHNSYGARWLPGIYPRAFAGVQDGVSHWGQSIELLLHYYRLVHEHRGLFHNLGYGHSGAFDPVYGPRTAGRGRDKSLVDWALYDQHYGPLLDGSAFETAAPALPAPRRPATPISGVYTPLNPDWPASYLWWGEQGYEVEFQRCVRQFDAHLRQKGWVHSRFEFFFNHKKRYRWFGWDGDEVKDLKDMAYHREILRLWEAAVGVPRGAGTVPWVYRLDASWQMANQFDAMAGHSNFWVCGGFHRWYPDAVRRVIARGDTVWWYGGTPPIDAPSSAILSAVYQTWARGLHGYCAWQTTQPGPDPWFACDGCATGTLYPGERFGIPGPLPSIRLKVQRNGIQDVDLLKNTDRAALEQAIPIPLWSQPPKAARELPPEDWDSRNLAEEHEPVHQDQAALDPHWWQALRDRALGKEAR